MAYGQGARRIVTGVVAMAAALVSLLSLAACTGSPGTRSPTSAQHPVAASPKPTPTWNGTTEQRQFAPYDAAGTLTVRSSGTGTGSCFATSIAVPLAGVYRCLDTSNSLMDPCFAPAKEPDPPIVACFVSPWSDARIMTVTGAFPTYLPNLMAGDPWGIELANGVRCVSVTGAVPSYNDVDLTYRCDGQNMAGIDTDANGNITAHYGPVDGPLIDVGVMIAWRGRSYRLSG